MKIYKHDFEKFCEVTGHDKTVSNFKIFDFVKCFSNRKTNEGIHKLITKIENKDRRKPIEYLTPKIIKQIENN